MMSGQEATTMDWVAGIPPEDMKVFLQEADEHLQRLDEDLVRLEREPAKPELLQEIFRAAHTLKGSSGMLGHRRMADVAHAMESVLDKLRKGTLAPSSPVIDNLLHGVDALRSLRDELLSGQESGVAVEPLLAELEQTGASENAPASPETDDQAETPLALGPLARERLPGLLAAGHTVHKVRVTLKRDVQWPAVRCFQVLSLLAEAGEVLCSIPSQEEIEQEKACGQLDLVLATTQSGDALRQIVASVDEVERAEVTPYGLLEAPLAPEGEPSGSAKSPQGKGGPAPTVRVDVGRLDDLANTVGELVIDGTRVIQITRVLEGKYKGDELVEALGKTSAHIVKLADELQEGALKMRMLPIGTVFTGFHRTVRDLAQRASKKVDFVIEGQETEIDRGVIERLRDPLIHLLRNSVDHGLEPPEQRRAAGKGETGLIRLAAYHEQGHIVITIEDDGRGIDPRSVRDAAVRKGLISAEAASRLSDTEAIDLIFMPGASTAEKVTEVSGRGVGMDIVRTNIEAINGFVTVDTRVGQGTRVTLKLPLTLATLRALLVSLDHAIYAIPLVHILEAVKLERGKVSTIGGREVMRLRGDVLPLLELSGVLGLRARGVGEADCFAVVVRFGEKRVGLVVDSLMDSQEIVVKSLGGYIGRVRGIGGASVLGDGRVVLILDVPSLLNTAFARVGNGMSVVGALTG
ncbi:MAG: CheA signal transduction histidine kinase [Dehalococcoidia bacterium]|nr:CheA signal transduction histidine kinase [Dehalococcoidia bacterium]